MAIGALAQRAVVYDRATREGRWEIRNSYKAVDLDGKTLGLIGIGRIGSMVARRVAVAYNMKVIAYDPYVTPEKARELGVTLCAQMDDVFRQADVISLHTAADAGNPGVRQRKETPPDEADRISCELLQGGGRQREGALRSSHVGRHRCGGDRRLRPGNRR